MELCKPFQPLQQLWLVQRRGLPLPEGVALAPMKDVGMTDLVWSDLGLSTRLLLVYVSGDSSSMRLCSPRVTFAESICKSGVPDCHFGLLTEE